MGIYSNNLNVINLTNRFVLEEEFSELGFMISRIFSSRPDWFHGSLKNTLQISSAAGHRSHILAGAYPAPEGWPATG